jgi:hypothetical protein
MRNIKAGDPIMVTEEEALEGVVFIECPECEGTGLFEMADGEFQPCNCCKTTGLMAISC